MSRSPVEVVLINWKRPANITQIIDALKIQTVPCTITVCDCHPAPEFALDPETLAKIDRTYRWPHNLGAYSRYVPAAAYDHEFTYLPDDDMLPGRRCLEHFLDHTSRLDFGVLGQIGRRLKPDGIYRTDKVLRTRTLEEVDLVVRAYFVRTRNLCHVAAMRWDLGLQGTSDAEDDIILGLAMQLKAGLGSYLTPHSFDDETSVVQHKLPAPHALSKRSNHLELRTGYFRQAMDLGWTPYHRRAKPAAVRAIRALLG